MLQSPVWRKWFHKSWTSQILTASAMKVTVRKVPVRNYKGMIIMRAIRAWPEDSVPVFVKLQPSPVYGLVETERHARLMNRPQWDMGLLSSASPEVQYMNLAFREYKVQEPIFCVKHYKNVHFTPELSEKIIFYHNKFKESFKKTILVSTPPGAIGPAAWPSYTVEERWCFDPVLHTRVKARVDGHHDDFCIYKRPRWHGHPGLYELDLPVFVKQQMEIDRHMDGKLLWWQSNKKLDVFDKEMKEHWSKGSFPDWEGERIVRRSKRVAAMMAAAADSDDEDAEAKKPKAKPVKIKIQNYNPWHHCRFHLVPTDGGSVSEWSKTEVSSGSEF